VALHTFEARGIAASQSGVLMRNLCFSHSRRQEAHPVGRATEGIRGMADMDVDRITLREDGA
tara:strand:- start:1330 stop:1515 length:186 start_codon:yes stop_codon:yes gene_type:complete